VTLSILGAPNDFSGGAMAAFISPATVAAKVVSVASPTKYRVLKLNNR
jgi:hypothetical protein